jgi:hypothetical protein
MNLKKLIAKFYKSPFAEDTISYLSNDGRHIGTSGKVIPVLTDERLKTGDRVITVTDEDGKSWTIGGRK